MTRLFPTLCLCCLFPLFFSFAAPAAPHLDVGVSTGYPPYYYATDEGYRGLCVDLLEEAAAILDVEIVYHEYPWRRMLLQARKGVVDAVMPLFRTEERQKYLEFSDLVLSREEVSLFVERGSVLAGLPPARLYEYPIGVVADYSYGEGFDSRDDITTIACRNDEHLLRMFSHGQFEVGIGNRYVVLHNAGRLGLNDAIAFIQPPVSQEPLYMGFSKKSNKREMARSFSRVLRKLRNGRSYGVILERYGITGIR